MSPKAKSLLSRVSSPQEWTAELQANYNNLAAYIEELERKAAAYDNMDATAEAMCRMSAGDLQRKLAELEHKAAIYDDLAKTITPIGTDRMVRDVDGNPNTVV